MTDFLQEGIQLEIEAQYLSNTKTGQYDCCYSEQGKIYSFMLNTL